MIIEIAKLSPDGSSYIGELPGEILDLDQDKFAHADGPVHCDLFAYLVSHELIVKGTIKAPIKLLCGRCAGFFSTFLVVSSFLRAYPITEGVDKVDLSEDIREDVLLEIPNYPACSWEGSGVCPHSGVNLDEMKIEEMPPENSPWSILDNFDGSSSHKN
ncbi:MAG TPA: DUF177 domain-containing protein [Kiritimatiellia bacterium]|nr:DUF177 domain-containing protein [Kiritimatiellia bacterium]